MLNERSDFIPCGTKTSPWTIIRPGKEVYSMKRHAWIILYHYTDIPFKVKSFYYCCDSESSTRNLSMYNFIERRKCTHFTNLHFEEWRSLDVWSFIDSYSLGQTIKTTYNQPSYNINDVLRRTDRLVASQSMTKSFSNVSSPRYWYVIISSNGVMYR
jgi:hypothetical protein